MFCIVLFIFKWSVIFQKSELRGFPLIWGCGADYNFSDSNIFKKCTEPQNAPLFPCISST